MRLRQLRRIDAVAARDWDALFDPHYPFTRHAYLKALEDHGCVAPSRGWQPCHVVLEDGATLLAAAPLYLKAHSFGEFVFDWTWAEACERLGQNYYPKLLCAIPFTPVAGPRVGARSEEAHRALALALTRLPGEQALSSLHALFLGEADRAALTEAGCIERWDVQFHWRDRDYGSFDGFLSRLRADKRKKILRERRRVAEAGIRFEQRPGPALSEAEWHEVYALYANTYEERGQRPYLTLPFLLDYGRQSDSPVWVILAFESSRMVAAALTLLGADTLYGRHWGAAEHYHSLHFETCYYQGIELCLRRGLKTFDAGTQGEHKLARGFQPLLTRSAHTLADTRLHEAVDHHLRRERAFVQSRYELYCGHSPFREDVGNG